MKVVDDGFRVRLVMRFFVAAVLAFAMSGLAFAGDDASGPVPFRVDLSQHLTANSMTTQDHLWSASRFIYKGRAVHFVRTSIPLNMGDQTIQGGAYQALEKPDVFYVVNSDAMLKLGTKWAYNPGLFVHIFSHAPFAYPSKYAIRATGSRSTSSPAALCLAMTCSCTFSVI